LILEIGLEHSPVWAYAVMLFCAGLTAFYTFRMVWLMFFGKEREYLQVHSAGFAMKVSLGILAAGTCITWLFFGGLNELLTSTLPFHGLEHETLREMIVAVISAPATWLAMSIVAVGLGTSWLRARGLALFGGGWLNPFVESSFGFEWVNHLLVRGTYRIAAQLSATQTGELNWNILGIISALLVVLLVLWLGA